jgi:LPXTG-motif cell wall-anchored protein
MSRRLAVLAVLVVACLAFAATAQAQVVVKQEIRQGTVVHAGENFLVVKLADGTIKGFDVPNGFMFNMGDTQVPLSALQPGQVITATITSATAPVVETTEEVKQGTVVRVVGRNLFVQMADGKYKKFVVPQGYRFEVEGKKLPVEELRPGMKLSATVVSEREVGTVSAAELQASVSAPPPAPAAALAPAAASAPAAPPPPQARAKQLPKTASLLPLIGLLGLLSLGLGAGLSFRRRRE